MVISTLRSMLRRMGEQYPRTESSIDKLWNTYEHLRFSANAYWNNYKYRNEPASVNPYQVISIDPSVIKRNSPGNFHFLSDSGSIVGGDWDSEPSPVIEDRYRYQSFRTHFIEGVPWEATEFYRRKISKIESGKQAKYETISAFKARCAALDQLYEDIKKNGYRTQQELISEGATGGLGDGGALPFVRKTKSAVRHEISVDVARDGEPMLNEGRHRLCIAKLLNLESVPVRIVARHRRWQNLRNEFVRRRSDATDELESELPETLVIRFEETVLGLEHPDLRAAVERR